VTVSRTSGGQSLKSTRFVLSVLRLRIVRDSYRVHGATGLLSKEGHDAAV